GLVGRPPFHTRCRGTRAVHQFGLARDHRRPFRRACRRGPFSHRSMSFMASFSGFGRAASAAILIGAVMFSASVRAQDVNDEHMQAARKAIASIGLTDRFDTILPGLAERLKAQLIQAYPNFVDEISTTVDQQAIALAARRADLEKEAAQVYAKSFTVEELNAISTFYNSEAGKK